MSPSPVVTPALAAQCVTAAGWVHCSQTGSTHHDSLQIPFTNEVPHGVKVSLSVNPHSSLCNTLFPLLPFLNRFLRLLIHPLFLALNASLSFQKCGQASVKCHPRYDQMSPKPTVESPKFLFLSNNQSKALRCLVYYYAKHSRKYQN